MANDPAKTRIIFLGAGALGRGYLPWRLDSSRHEFVYVDSDRAIVDQLNSQGSFTTYRVKEGGYEKKTVWVTAAVAPGDFNLAEHQDAIACFIAVGPGNVRDAVQILAGSRIPLIVCENDPKAIDVTKRVVRHDAVYFAVPDVITSSTAPPELLAEDPLSITSEDGQLYVEAGIGGVHGDIAYLPRHELLRLQWMPKLFLHNTPHCVAAYLGAIMGKTYIHEVMECAQAAQIVEGAMRETLRMLVLQGEIPRAFLEWYAEKELARFRCPLLFDPVARVARDPLRKLAPEGRLLGAVELCLKFGVEPRHLLKGVVGAMWFECARQGAAGAIGQAGQMEFDSLIEDALGSSQKQLLATMLRGRMSSILEEFQAMTVR